MTRSFDAERAQREIARVLRAGDDVNLRTRLPHIFQVLEGMADLEEAARDLIRSFGAMLGDRWTTLIVHVLRDGPFRYTVLHRLIGAVSDLDAISQRMLSLRLRALERDGMVIRIVSNDTPPHVEYALTEVGRSFSEQAGHFSEWVTQRMAEIKASRELFDSLEENSPEEHENDS